MRGHELIKRFHLLPMLLAPVLALALQPALSMPLAQAAQPIYSKTGNCINYQTSLPSVTGADFRVFSPKSASAAAKAVANVIRAHDVFGVYERGLGISSLNQSRQTGKFPVFVDPGLRGQLGSVDGVTDNLCQHHDWEAVDIYPNLGSDELAATVYHELFHAAQGAVLRNANFQDNWWFEATATAAEAWFGSNQHKSYDSEVIDHPGFPMDRFDGAKNGAHEYGAYLFVQWVLKSATMPTSSQWAFLRRSIVTTYAGKPNWDQGLDNALSDLSSPSPCDDSIPRIACDIASFWGDETKPKPSFAKTASLRSLPIDPDTTEFTLPSTDLYSALTVALKPAKDQNQVQLVVPTLPAGVEVWIYLGKGKLEQVKAGQRFDKTFCRTGEIENSVPLPETGDIRIAMTTTEKGGAHKDIDFKTEASTAECKPGYGIKVIQQSVNDGGTTVADFTSLTCKVTKSGNTQAFTASGKSGAYTLKVSIKPFLGYNTDYQLQFQSSNPGFVVTGPGGPFSNLYWPGGTPPSSGGEITFLNKTVMGIGFINAFNASFSDSIAFAGNAPCHLGTS